MKFEIRRDTDGLGWALFTPATQTTESAAFIRDQSPILVEEFEGTVEEARARFEKIMEEQQDDADH